MKSVQCILVYSYLFPSYARVYMRNTLTLHKGTLR